LYCLIAIICREAANEVKTNGQKSSVARANLRKKIEEQHQESTVGAMLKLPKCCGQNFPSKPKSCKN
jgi:hypothetical protein